MLIRYAIFNGRVKDGQESAMRDYVQDALEPLWRQFAQAQDVQVLYGVEQDANGPEIPLILAISYADEAGMAAALASPARYESRDLLPGFYEQFFVEVKLFHYVMERT